MPAAPATRTISVPSNEGIPITRTTEGPAMNNNRIATSIAEPVGLVTDRPVHDQHPRRERPTRPRHGVGRVLVILAAILAAVATTSAFAAPATASAPQYCYNKTVTDTAKARAGNTLYKVTDNVTVCMRWNSTYGQYRISQWSQNKTYGVGSGYEFVDWSGSWMTGGNNHLAFNSVAVGNFKFCATVWVVGGCPFAGQAWTKITFQITNPATGAATWYTARGHS
jgi:hypothetical protein